MAEYYPQPAAGQRLTAELLRSMLPQVARKTADTSRSATTTPVADPHLTFAVEADAVYVWDGWIKYFADPAADLSVDFSVPSGSEGEWHSVMTGSGATTATTLGYSVRTEATDITTSRNMYGTSDANHGAVLHGIIRVGDTAGTFSLDWAQGTSSATATTLFTDSWIRFQRIV